MISLFTNKTIILNKLVAITKCSLNGYIKSKIFELNKYGITFSLDIYLNNVSNKT